ncbi:hypothetical protein MMC07_002515 [Pseudocyphellaria aurata]|nr:hypothetical protein [Pseudocyphellaria aurata]
MALSIAKAAPLKPEIKLFQALSEFEAILPDDQKANFRTHRGQSPPNSTDVIRLTADIDREACRNRKSRQCVGTRLMNVLHAVQQFSNVVDVIVGTSQSQIAGAIWGAVKMSLQLASTISTYFDHLSTLFMRIGRSCPRYQDFGLLYPRSTRLQGALCEYFIVIVRLCKQAVLFLNKPFWSQLSSSIFKPFESVFGTFQQDLENLASNIRGEASLASYQAQQNEAKETSDFRAFFSDASAREVEEARTYKRRKAEARFLNACSTFDHEKYWKQARKLGSTPWICNDESYKQWKLEKSPSALWCTGILGSGKTVLSANVVEDLKITTQAAVTYFFCRYDEANSMETRTILGSIARQIFEQIKLDGVDAEVYMRSDSLDTDQILDYLWKLLPSNSPRCFVIIDGLDECKENERRLLLECLKRLQMSKHAVQIYCSSRPDMFPWARTLLEPKWVVSMSPANDNIIGEYIEDTLMNHLDSGLLSIGDSRIILKIRDALLNNAHGMFIWVVFQIHSICFQETDEAILTALETLPKDLPETFNRILRKLQQSNATDLPFCRKIFDLIAIAQRPLTLEELREAVSVRPGDTSWNASNMVNDMLRLILHSCGSLVSVDEEHLTVHFTHHSVRQHFLSVSTDPKVKEYHINLKEADLRLGEIIVTYLNFDIFDLQVVKTESTMVPQLKNYPSAILDGILTQSNLANKLAMKILKSRGGSRVDIHHQLGTAARIAGGSKQVPLAHPFFPYAQEFWLFHTKAFSPTRVAEYSLWQRLIDGRAAIIELPWSPKKWYDFDDEYLKWIIQNEHWALIDLSLARLTEVSSYSPTTKLLLEFLENRVTTMKAQRIKYGAALYLASCLNNEAVVSLSLEKGADINASYGRVGNALQAASYYGQEKVAKLLLENGADVDAKSGTLGTALQAASGEGHTGVVKCLLENGAAIGILNNEVGTALQAASKGGHEDTARLLLKNGADINSEGGQYGTALQAALIYDQTDMARFLLVNGANVNAGGGHCGTALHLASACGHKEMAKFLLKNGADINIGAENERCGTPFQTAVRNDQKKMARFLFENGAREYNRALHKASAWGHQTLLEGYMTGTGGHEATARFLPENGANVNGVGGRFGTALQAASRGDHKETARLLLMNWVDVNAVGGRYGTALHAASRNGHEPMARLLVENGANVNVVAGEYGTALQVASRGNYESIARFLVENGANVNTQGGFYGTALEVASIYRGEPTVRLLLENEAIATSKILRVATLSGDERIN